MRLAIIILLLVLSTLFIGCAQKTTDLGNEQKETTQEMTDEEALNEVDNSLIDENSEVEIGEMI